MKAITYNNLSSADRESVDSQFRSIVEDTTAARIRQGVKFTFHLNDEDIEVLQSFFPRRLVIQDPKENYKTSAHPILAALNEFCNKEVDKYIQSMRDRDRVVLSIGDAARLTQRCDHNCLLIDSARDHKRLVEQSVKFPTQDPRSKVHKKLPVNGCYKGAHNCTFKADVAVAVHSIYNITPEEIVKIFVNHQIAQLTAYVFIPLGLFDSRLKNLDEKVFRVRRNNGDYAFSMRDFALAYIHDSSNWKLWAELVAIAAVDFDIIIERTINYGPLFVLNFVRVPKYHKIELVSFAPLDDIVDNVYLVPNIMIAADNHFATPQDELEHLLIPRHVVETVFAYAQRQADEAYKFVEFATLTSGLQRSLKIGSIVYAERWAVNPHEYFAAVLSMFIIGASTRTDRTQYISAAFNHMRDWRGSYFTIFRQAFFRIVNSIFGTNQDNAVANINEINASRIWQYKIRTFKLKPLNRVFHVHKIRDLNVVPSRCTNPFGPCSDDEDDRSLYHDSDDRSLYRGNTSPGGLHDHSSLRLDDPSAYDDDPYFDDDSDVDMPMPTSSSPNNQSPTPFDQADAPITRTYASPNTNVITLADGPANLYDGHDENKNKCDDELNRVFIEGDAALFVKPTTVYDDNDTPYNPDIAPISIAIEDMSQHSNDDTDEPPRTPRPTSEGSFNGEPSTTPVSNSLIPTPEQMKPDSDSPSQVDRVKPSPISTVQQVETGIFDETDADYSKLFHNVDHININEVAGERYYIGDYSQIPKRTNYVYVNCANEYVTDGAGQAAAFRSMFPGYDKHVNKPVTDPQCFTYGPHELCVIVAPRWKRPTDHAKLDDIIFHMNRHYAGTNKNVMLPLFGTGIFGVPMACLKRAFDGLRFQHTLCFHNEAQRKQWDSTQICLHDTDQGIDKFKHGHCMLRSFYSALPNIGTIRSFINRVHKEAYMLVGSYDFYHLDIIRYIHYGEWRNNPFVDYIFQILCDTYDVHLVINIDNGASIRHIGKGHQNMTIYYDSIRQHYYNLRGGAIDKFDEIIPEIVKHTNNAAACVFDVSAAPGYLCQRLHEAYKQAGISVYTYVGHFKPGAQMSQKIDPKESATMTYSDFNQYMVKLRDFNKDMAANNRPIPNVIICDAARKYNTEELTNIFVDNVRPLCTPGCSLLIKTFGNPISTWKLATEFRSYNTIKTNVGSEVYYHLIDYHGQPDEQLFRAIRQTNNSTITKHQIPYEKVAVDKFRRNFFSKIQINRDIKGECDDDVFTINAITGYAGAAKSSRAIELYPDALYIAPTKHLAIDLNNRQVRCYTPHTALSEVRKFNTIVIDEISQFHIEYLMLIHSINPSADIFVLGDKYQTPPFADDKTRTRTVFDFGVQNNIFTSHTIPQDVCGALNKRYQLDILTDCKIVDSILRFTGNIKELIKLPMIVYNDVTREKYEKMGFAVSTITTYQGSRAPAVIFVIDDQAVQTQLINQTQWVYTAMTRHTNKLVLYGNTEYIEKYFNIRGTNITTYEEISNLMVYNDAVQSDMLETSDVNITKQADAGIASDTHNLEAALHDIKELVKNVNEASAVNAYTSDPVLPKPHDGVVKTHIENLLTKQTPVTGKRLVRDLCIVRQQVSNDTRESFYTMVKRYGKKHKRLGLRDESLNTNQLERGLIRAITGRNRNYNIFKFRKDMQCTHDELSREYRAYLERLNKKVQEGKMGVVHQELSGEFNEYNEVLNFINKRQAKYVAAEAFDGETKAGQGVASMSKRVNLLFSAYACLMLDKIRNIAIRNGCRLILATHGSDEKISEVYAAYRNADANDNKKWACNDVSEWDASFQSFMIKLTSRLLTYMGCPTFAIEWFETYRSEWKMIYHAKIGNTTLLGHHKQFSGSPFTIAENTVMNVALMHALFEFKNATLMLFKGDDSAILCDDCTLTVEGARMLELTGHKLKLHIDDIGEFAGFLLLRTGMFPDVPRKFAKFVGKIYKDEEHFQESVMSVRDSMAVVKNQRQFEEGLVANELFYHHRIRAEQVRNMATFLLKSRQLEFNDLTGVKLDVLSADAAHIVGTCVEANKPRA